MFTWIVTVACIAASIATAEDGNAVPETRSLAANNLTLPPVVAGFLPTSSPVVATLPPVFSAGVPNVGDILTLFEGNGLTMMLAAAAIASFQNDLSNGLKQLTLFVPSNAAFESLGNEYLQTLMQSYNSDFMKLLLNNHVFGTLLSTNVLQSLVGGSTPTNLAGFQLPVLEGELGLIIGGAQITDPDIAFLNNGIPAFLQIIDQVIIPPTITGSSEFTILTALINDVQDGYFAQVLSNITSTGYTFFAPSDSAFKKLPAAYRTFPLGAKAQKTMLNVLKYHIVPVVHQSSNFNKIKSLSTLQGKSINVQVKNDKILLNNNAKVTQPDWRASNGMIQVVNAVLLPPQSPLRDVLSG